MEKPIIELWDSTGFGLIIEYPTGVLVSNQTGGYCCYHPTIEGIYVPLGNELYVQPSENESRFTASRFTASRFTTPEDDLTDYFTGEKYVGYGATGGLDEADGKAINAILAKYDLANIRVDETKLKQSHEAWVFVKIIEDNDRLSVFRHFAKNNSYLTGVITWQNSD